MHVHVMNTPTTNKTPFTLRLEHAGMHLYTLNAQASAVLNGRFDTIRSNPPHGNLHQQTTPGDISVDPGQIGWFESHGLVIVFFYGPPGTPGQSVNFQ